MMWQPRDRNIGSWEHRPGPTLVFQRQVRSNPRGVWGIRTVRAQRAGPHQELSWDLREAQGPCDFWGDICRGREEQAWGCPILFGNSAINYPNSLPSPMGWCSGDGPKRHRIQSWRAHGEILTLSFLPDGTVGLVNFVLSLLLFIWLFWAVIPGSALGKSLLVVLRAHYGMPEIGPGLALCKASALPSMLSLWFLRPLRMPWVSYWNCVYDSYWIQRLYCWEYEPKR